MPFDKLKKNCQYIFNLIPCIHFEEDNKGCVDDRVSATLRIQPLPSWYFHNLKRVAAEELLLAPGNENGSFLLRNPENTYKGFSLSVLYEREVLHYQIGQRGDKSLLFIEPNYFFPTLEELVAHYSANANGLCTALRQPCVRDVKIIDRFDSMRISSKDVKQYEQIGSGNFANVYRGKAFNNADVAIKILNKSGSMNDFIREARLMQRLRHNRVVQLYAVCMQQEPFFIVTELMKHGSLHQYLKRKRTEKLPLGKMVRMAENVTDGMSYLESQRIIHRDLAARNVLVGDAEIVKIADFGLARAIQNNQYNNSANTTFAFKWTAPEAYGTEPNFTPRSDVWSFGILLHEIVTYGGEPYKNMSKSETMEFVLRGKRMAKPENCPDMLYEIMVQCWNIAPELRPSFMALKEHFAKNYPQYLV